MGTEGAICLLACCIGIGRYVYMTRHGTTQTRSHTYHSQPQTRQATTESRAVRKEIEAREARLLEALRREEAERWRVEREREM